MAADGLRRIYPLCEAALLPGKHPPPEREQFTDGKKRPKDHLVALGQPTRQVEIEVIQTLEPYLE